MISFDQNQINELLINGRTFESATLQLYVVDNGNNWGPDGRLIGTHLILEDWTEGNGWNVGNTISGTGDGTTWNCPIDTDISNNLDNCSTQWNGGNFAATPSSTTLITNNILNQQIEFDVTSDVQSFLDGTKTNHGWMVKKDDESQNGTIEFASKESTNIPQLIITVNLSQAEILFNQYEDLQSELELIGQIADEAVVSDYLVDSITKLKTDTQNLVTDVVTRDTLIAILDSALQSANEAGNNVLVFNESAANLKISEAKNFVDSYANQVSVFSGTTIPTTDADFLISKANQISNDSLKRDIDSAELVSGTPLLITSQIINLAKSNSIEIKNIVDEFVALGFTLNIDAETSSPTTGSITFENPNTLQEFTIVITSLMIVTADTTQIFEDNLQQGLQMTDEQFAILLTSMKTIFDAIQEVIPGPKKESFFKLSICLQNKYILGICATFAAGIGLGLYLQFNQPEIVQLIQATLANAVQSVQNVFNDTFLPDPVLIVIKEVIPIFGGTATPGDFTMLVTNDITMSVTSFQGKSSPGEILTLSPGSYTVSEEPKSGYNLFIPEGQHCDQTGKVVLAQGDLKTCEVENHSLPAKLTVIKKIINDNDGSLTLADVTLKVNSEIVANGTQRNFIAGTYQVNEDPIADYDKSFTGDCDEFGVVTLDVNDTKTCTITNNDVPSTPPPVFFENFDGEEIQGAFGAKWIFSAPGCPIPGVSCFGTVETTFSGFSPPSPPNWGVMRMQDGSPGTCRNNLSIIHTFVFSNIPAGNYELSATLASQPCSGCIITSLVFVSDFAANKVVGIIQHKGQDLSIEPFDPNKIVSFESEIISLNGGAHAIAAVMSPSRACFGNFRGAFDNVSLVPVGAQATSSAASVGGPYFYAEINQTSINATKPTQVTVPLKVEWFDGYYAEPVNIQLFIGNYTDNGIYGTVTSVQNATMYKMYDLTFDISNSTHVGQEDIGVLVTEIDSGDTEWKSIIFNISE